MYAHTLETNKEDTATLGSNNSSLLKKSPTIRFAVLDYLGPIFMKVGDLR